MSTSSSHHTPRTPSARRDGMRLLAAALLTVAAVAGCAGRSNGLDGPEGDASAVCRERSGVVETETMAGGMTDEADDRSYLENGVRDPNGSRLAKFRSFDRCMEAAGATCGDVICTLFVPDRVPRADDPYGGSAGMFLNPWVVCATDPASPAPSSTTTLPNEPRSGYPLRAGAGCPPGTVARPPST